ncbi:chloramphenicol acetyltransferase [Flammeovirga sp. EKP202]|uniref:chloramphenicol acetyltransferase n=1 Tax=Flammeovirga sp. EKP202 TaxID=2770592 RepID=UPI00165FCBB6|nr:chloramphenicol acetyltransferase [Flammeovirga sp. EKP202]MBD0405406.1 chloramphenicol acetyltransferase [Flammeovirga sp. EKP202]
MKKIVDIENWNRKEHYHFFSKFSEPFHGITVKVDCTKAYDQAKERGVSFFLYYLYRSIKAANQIVNFRYRILEGKVYEYDSIRPSCTIGREDGTFGFSYLDYHEQEDLFYKKAKEKIGEVKKSTSLFSGGAGDDVIHFSAIPWINFTSLSHARSFEMPDSVPKISFGQLTEEGGMKSMSVSIHVHHALVDAYHVGQFIEQFQNLLNAE